MLKIILTGKEAEAYCGITKSTTKKKQVKPLVDALVSNGCRNVNTLAQHIRKISGWNKKRVQTYLRRYMGVKVEIKKW